MCLAIPAQIMRIEGSYAQCSSREGVIEVDLSLIGEYRVGSWVLVFLGAARECIDPQRAMEINSALDAIEAIAQGQAHDLDRFFPDLVHVEPQLPAHLQKQFDDMKQK